MSSSSQPHRNENIDPIDIIIGKRIKFRRRLLGITQDGLARKLGISFQQIQKYESGQNKIYAGRLYHISLILKTPLTYFFEDESKPGLSDQTQEGFVHDDLINKSETATLVRVYYDIQDKKKRKTALEMMKAFHS